MWWGGRCWVGYIPIMWSHQLGFWLKLGCDNTKDQFHRLFGSGLKVCGGVSGLDTNNLVTPTSFLVEVGL